jgi:hypothetical protein
MDMTLIVILYVVQKDLFKVLIMKAINVFHVLLLDYYDALLVLFMLLMKEELILLTDVCNLKIFKIWLQEVQFQNVMMVLALHEEEKMYTF